jgi:hypothetical protein
MFQVSSREGVQQSVLKIAELLKKYGDSFLQGEPSFYGELEEANRRASAEYAKRQARDRVRKRAEAAWSEKDFARVVDLYGSIRDELGDIESNRFRYACKHTGPTDA